MKVETPNSRKIKKKNQECRVHREYGSRENSREGQHRKEQRIAVRYRTIKTNDADEYQKMNRCQKHRE